MARLAAVIVCGIAAIALTADAAAQPSVRLATADEGAWFPLSITGGTATLDALGVPETLPRALAMTELVRRLHFPNYRVRPLLAAIERLFRDKSTPLDTPPVIIPLPLSPQTWQRVILERNIPPERLFISILADRNARLLYHGLVALDADTRRWFGSQRALLKQLYRNPEALEAFALFGPAIRIRDGALLIPGGALAATRWATVLDVDARRLDRFVTRLITRDGGRLLGLYFTIANSAPARQAFLLGPAAATSERFQRLASRFAGCYQTSPGYPFSIAPNDPALLLLEIDVSPQGTPAGPGWRRFWSEALTGDGLPDNPPDALRNLTGDGLIDGAWLVDAICDPPPEARAAVLEALLFANRTFAGLTDAALPDALVAVRGRRLYPAVMMALEQAGVRDPATYARLARHAEQVARVDDPSAAIPLLQQFQGTVALTLTAIRAQTVTVEAGSRLLDAIASVPLTDGRYGGRLAAWFLNDWLPAGPLTADQRLIDAMSGPSDRRGPIDWEGLPYVLDIAADSRRQLQDARRRQGGPALESIAALGRLVADLGNSSLTVDRVRTIRSELAGLAPQLVQLQPAAELLGNAPNLRDRIDDALRDLERIDEPRRLSRARDIAGDLTPILDLLFGHALASWVYAPHIGDAGDALLGDGDPSVRHEFGLRLPGRLKTAQRWDVAWRGDREGPVSGALLGLDAALARRALRRFASDALPPPPELSLNEIRAMESTVAMSAPLQFTDAARDRIAAAVAAGTAAVARAGRDQTALGAAADAAAISAWRRQALAWTAVEDAERLGTWFSPSELAWVGGLKPEDVDAWGTAFLTSGCLCRRMPRLSAPETLTGRQTAGVLSHLAPDLMFRIASVLALHRLPAPLARWVERFAMRELIDRVRPAHLADLTAFAPALERISQSQIEDYIGAVAARGPLMVADDKEN
jgi:hypothetical protein